jgi:hypothetical protein
MARDFPLVRRTARESSNRTMWLPQTAQRPGTDHRTQVDPHFTVGPLNFKERALFCLVSAPAPQTPLRRKIDPSHGTQSLHPRRQPHPLRFDLLRCRLHQYCEAARLPRRRRTLAHNGPRFPGRRSPRRPCRHLVVAIRAGRAPCRRSPPSEAQAVNTRTKQYNQSTEQAEAASPQLPSKSQTR